MYIIKIKGKEVKEYPFHHQCLTWLSMKGFIYQTGKSKWADPDIKISKKV